MLNKLIDILKSISPDTDVSGVTMETRLREDLGLASYDFVVILFEIEEEFGVTFPEAASFETVGEVCEFLKKNTGLS